MEVRWEIGGHVVQSSDDMVMMIAVISNRECSSELPGRPEYISYHADEDVLH